MAKRSSERTYEERVAGIALSTLGMLSKDLPHAELFGILFKHGLVVSDK
jgi:hypothetical protein